MAAGDVLRLMPEDREVVFSSLKTQGHYLYASDEPAQHIPHWQGHHYLYASDDPANAEYVVQVDWIKTVLETQAVKEIGFFGNQNSVCRPRDQKWVYTVERLKKVWGIES